MSPAISQGKTLYAQASIMKRLLAFAVDLLIINIVILFPFDRVYEKLFPTGSFSKTFEFLSSNTNNLSITIVTLTVSLITILYFVILEKKLKQTPGKMLFKLYIDGQGKDLRYWQLFIRSMFLIPLFPFVLLWFIDPIIMFFNKDNQRLSEILSRTKVVEKYKI
jgi:uncharacterized RDD family membrane protein YckC